MEQGKLISPEMLVEVEATPWFLNRVYFDGSALRDDSPEMIFVAERAQ
jgi:hypothetical protein